MLRNTDMSITYEVVGTTPGGLTVSISREERQPAFRVSTEVLWGLTTTRGTGPQRLVRRCASRKAARLAGPRLLATLTRREGAPARKAARTAAVAERLGVEASRVAVHSRGAKGSVNGPHYDPAVARITIDGFAAEDYAPTEADALERAITLALALMARTHGSRAVPSESTNAR